MTNIQIQMIETTALSPYVGNARAHSKKQIAQVADSLRTFGFITPVVVDPQRVLVAGHARWLAAKSIGLTRIPAICADHLTPQQLRAYALADNKIAENATWDKSLLRVELESLMNADLDFSITTTGFCVPEIDLILHSTDTIDPPPGPLPAPAETVTRPGDLWKLGKHYIFCGDVRDPAAIERALSGDRVSLVITDPPFNCPVNGHVSGLGDVRHREFAMASGEMSSPEFTGFLGEVMRRMAEVCVDGALLYVFMDWRNLSELKMATAGAGLDEINFCVWVKTNAGMGSLYRSQHEMVSVLKKGNAPHTNNVELGKHGRYRTNVWNYPGMNAFGADRDEALRWHPTVKPVAMIRDAILDASHPDDWVLDGFLGSGTTLLACEQSRRRCIGVEIDPAYVDVAIDRWRTLTGEVPYHVDLEMDWTAVRQHRADKQKAA